MFLVWSWRVVRSYSEETCRFVLETFLQRFDMTAQSPQSPACSPVLIQCIDDNVSRCWMKHSDTLAGLIPSGTSYGWKKITVLFVWFFPALSRPDSFFDHASSPTMVTALYTKLHILPRACRVLFDKSTSWTPPWASNIDDSLSRRPTRISLAFQWIIGFPATFSKKNLGMTSLDPELCRQGRR